MLYQAKATSSTPAFILFLLDISKSMKDHIPQVQDAIVESVLTMVDWSTILVSADRPPVVKPRYYLAFLLYNESKEFGGDGVENPYFSINPSQLPGKLSCPGFLPIDQVAQDVGIPKIKDCRAHTDTALGFQAAKEILENLIPQIPPKWPAPLVCHITDVKFNRGGNPKTIAQEIMKLRTADGPVLIENVFINDEMLNQPISNVAGWTGVYSKDQLKNQKSVANCSEQDSKLFQLYETIFDMSSTIPESYLDQIKIKTFKNMRPNSKLLFPGKLTSIIKAAIAVSTVTGSK